MMTTGWLGDLAAANAGLLPKEGKPPVADDDVPTEPATSPRDRQEWSQPLVRPHQAPLVGARVTPVQNARAFLRTPPEERELRRDLLKVGWITWKTLKRASLCAFLEHSVPVSCTSTRLLRDG